MKQSLALPAVLAAILAAYAPSGEAQSRTVRFGTGTHLMVSTVDGVGLGLTGRVSMPLNDDLSLAIGSGFTGFLFGGTEDAEWLLTPQVSLIVTLPGIMKAPYFAFGAGGYLPLGDPGRDRAGPTINFAAGYVRALSQSSLYYEVNPMLILEDNRIDIALPVRIGVIF